MNFTRTIKPIKIASKTKSFATLSLSGLRKECWHNLVISTVDCWVKVIQSDPTEATTSVNSSRIMQSASEHLNISMIINNIKVLDQYYQFWPNSQPHHAISIFASSEYHLNISMVIVNIKRLLNQHYSIWPFRDAPTSSCNQYLHTISIGASEHQQDHQQFQSAKC